MIQLGKFVGGGVAVLGWLTPTTYIQLAGAGSKRKEKTTTDIPNAMLFTTMRERLSITMIQIIVHPSFI